MPKDPGRNWKDAEVRELGVDPRRVRRWFLDHYGITFHHYLRGQRLTKALHQISLGSDLSQVALDAGYESESGFRTAFTQWFGCPVSHASNLNDPVQINRILSPLGPLIVVSDSTQIYLLEFADRKMIELQFNRLTKLLGQPLVPGENDLMNQAHGQLDEYFQGSRMRFDLPISIQGTPFQVAVWNQLLQIEYGSTASYEEVAQKIGNPRACRAVGRANSENRIAVVIPCHRVIRQSGQLSGYGGGVRRKEWMLEHERAVCRTANSQENPGQENSGQASSRQTASTNVAP